MTAGRRRILVDCGLFQGLKELRLRNWAEPPFVPAELDAIVLTHAHIDHSGYLPLLAKRGFSGPVYCTPGTADLLRIMLPDSGHLQEEDAARANRWSYSKHHPALPLYTREDALDALALLEARKYHDRFEVVPGIDNLFRRAGHILGSANAELELHDAARRLAWSGDVGRTRHLFLRGADPIPAADVAVVESTYGDRTHLVDPDERLAELVRATAERGGAMICPAFAVGRAQELVWLLRRLQDAGRIPVLPIYVDSPMAVDVTDLTLLHADELAVDPAVLRDPRKNPFRSANLRYTRSPEESIALNRIRGPIIIISASGMATGGRVLHHLRLRLPDPATTVVLAGFQAAGTRGRSLQDGVASVRIHGEDVPVRARVETLEGLSAHADRAELLGWLRGFTRPPAQTYVVHGEPAQTTALVQTITQQLHWNVRAARDGETVNL